MLIKQKVYVVPMKICLLALLGLSIVDGSTETGSAAQLILRIFPQQVTLFGGGARQNVLVTTTDSLGVERDVTRHVQLQVDDEQIAELEENNVIRGLRAGSTKVRAVFKGQTVSAEIQVLAWPRKIQVSFIKDVVPILTKKGCAGSNCHGSIRGKSDFKLSLFGYEPDQDYEEILRGEDGRRLNLAHPEESLILRKPTFQVEHGGGLRFETDSPEYRAIREWIVGGAPYDSDGSPRIDSLVVHPRERRLVGVGAEQQLVVTARYTDGSSEDVTDKVQLSSNDGGIAAVDETGLVTAVRSGETSIMIRLLGAATAARIYVIDHPPGQNYPDIKTNNFIDELVFSKLQFLNILPSERSRDEDFVRRIFLDVLGTLPTIEETQEFLNSVDPKKRKQLMEEVLDRPERADFWAMEFADLFRLGFNEARDKGAKIFYDWLRQAFLQDRPFDRIVSELLVSQGNLYYQPTSNFYFVTRKLDPADVATHVSQSLLGVRLECAKCHNHPFEKWTQDDFYGFAAFFTRLGTKFVNSGSESNVYLRDEGEVIHPKTREVVRPRYLGGAHETEEPGEDIRQRLAQWLTRSDNPFFSRTIVNRIWRHYFGRGLVEPVDDFRMTNPPSNEKLLDALAEDFVAYGYSIKHTERMILGSRTYQLSALPNKTNRHDDVNHSHYYLKRMRAEQLLDAIVQVTGVEERIQGWPPGMRAMTIPHGPDGEAIRGLELQGGAYLMNRFGRIMHREFIVERDDDPNLSQVLHMINGETLHAKVISDQSHLARWLKKKEVSDRQILDRLFLVTLSRYPGRQEIRMVEDQLQGSDPEERQRTREEVFQDVLAALLNSKEFMYVH